MDREQPVEVMEITVMNLQETVGLVGSIAANESAEMRPEIPGVIESIHFEEGSAVKQGAVLAKLDTRELEAQLAETRASFQLAERNLERNRLLLEDDAVSKLEVDAAVTEHAKLKAAIDLLEVRLAKSSIIAPFDGMAGARSLSVGDFVTSQSIITTIDDLSRLKVEMQVPERYLPNLKPGGTFSLRAATSGPDTQVTGEVYFVSPRIDEDTRSTLVKGYVNKPPAYLKPGMFANITLVLRTVPDAMAVPETAILSSPRGTVLVMPKEKDGATIAEFVPVKTGLRIPGYVQVTPVGPPVKPGDKIVSAGVGGLILFPGMKLKPVEPVVTPVMPAETDRKLE
ncbi:MAG: efflux RND transporter periplasmic adaptor subunit [Verrucomicrobiaceae bacterium]|nr:MAG: efflux RND transporter periplasmic adaptor subunit [Verrucomicrobiaceae bacterium]